MEINFSKKKSIHRANFYKKEYVSSNFPIKVIGLIAGIIFLVCFVWFGIASRYIKINSLQSVLAEEKSSLDAINVKLNSYAEIEEDYLRYSKDYMSEEERGIVSRSDALNIVDKYLMQNCDVSRLQITNNEILTTLKNATMSTASEIIDQINMDTNNNIKYATTKNARNELNSDMPSVEMTIRMTNEISEVIDIE